MPLTTLDIDAVPIPASLHEGYRRSGYITDQTMSALLERAARQWPSRPALTEADRQLTYAELEALTRRAAGWLRAAGIKPGDVVCWQTPNWWEAHLLGLAIWQLGAVSNPIVPFYREHELRQILSQVRPAAVITVEAFRGFSHAEAFDDLLAETGLSGTTKIIVRGSRTGWTSFDDLLTHSYEVPPAEVSAHDPCLILFTSGTTSAPKGAVHSSQSLLAETRQLADAWGLGWTDATYMAAPLQHITGVLNAMSIPLLTGACAVLADRWDAEQAVRDILACNATYTAGATVFLQELTAAAASADARLPLRNFACGGAPVPRSVMQASEAQGIPASRVYGMTELPTVTVMNSAEDFEHRAGTDGRIAAGVEVRVVAEDLDVPCGGEGELVVRGPERMLGYLRASDNASALDGAGWFRTGDIGAVDADGYVRITGRLKDVINRGGEKFSAREIEDLLLGHPGVRAAAILPGADARLGEVPVAYVVLDDQSVTDAELVAYAASAGLARQKTPVAWHFLDALPMTPSGKVKKFELLAEPFDE
ncbi:MAG TPA: AMP-binding protein [Mycobacteriales bacterium]|jgi:acyl-CoA synthetase|nr:AMP-binding protein [Mycobacteriales bacterium]